MRTVQALKLAVLVVFLALGCHKYPTDPGNPTSRNYSSTGYPGRVDLYIPENFSGYVGKKAFAQLIEHETQETFAVAVDTITDELVVNNRTGDYFYRARLAFSPQAIPYGVYELKVLIDRDNSGLSPKTTGDIYYEPAQPITVTKELNEDVFLEQTTMLETGGYPFITLDGLANETYWDHSLYYWTLQEGDLSEATDGHWDPATAPAPLDNKYADLNEVRACWDANYIYLYINGEDTSDYMRTLVMIDWDSKITVLHAGDEGDKSIFTGVHDWTTLPNEPMADKHKLKFTTWQTTSSDMHVPSLGVDYFIQMPLAPLAAGPVGQDAYYLQYTASIPPPGNGSPEMKEIGAPQEPLVAYDAGSGGMEIKIDRSTFVGSFDSQPGLNLRLAVVTAAYYKNIPLAGDKSFAVYDVIPNGSYTGTINDSGDCFPILEDHSGVSDLANYISFADGYLYLELDANDDGIPDRLW